MLLYKNWLETRSRFLCCLGGMAVFCILYVHHWQQYVRMPAIQYPSDYCQLLFDTHQLVVAMWTLAVVLLGMGGLVREKALGTVPFTLTLPISRTRLMIARIAVGVAEAVVLGIVPWICIFVVMQSAGMPMEVSQLRAYIILLVLGGIVFYALAVLISCLVEGEYTAPSVAFGSVFMAAVGLEAWLRPYNVFRLVGGDFSINRSTWLLNMPLPWIGIGSSFCGAILLCMAAVFVVNRREF